MLEFINSYKEIIMISISLLSSIVAVIFGLLFSKKDKAKIIIGLLEIIPSLIIDAEGKCASGDGKFRYVVNGCLEYLETLGISRETSFKKYYALISTMVESILSTPQKKECRK